MGNVPACLNYPKLPGTSPDLSKVDSKVMNIISHFKEVTGTDMFTLTGSQFLALIRNLMSAAPIFIGSVVPPTQDEFNSKMFSLKAGGSVGQDSTINDIVYIYYFGKATGSSPPTSSSTSWWQSLFSPSSSTTPVSSADSTASVTPQSLNDIMKSIAPPGTPLPAVVTPGAPPVTVPATVPASTVSTQPATAPTTTTTTSAITPANPVADWSSYASNLMTVPPPATS
jgi:hypothetical protein